jgi:hypothetical protein
MAEKDEEQQTATPESDGETINDPLTRSGVEPPRKEFEGTNPE